MRVLVFGAGAIGCLYGGRLALAGHDVSVLARGRRLAMLREARLVLHNLKTKETQRPELRPLEALSEDDRFDLVLVTVRADQVSEALETLAQFPDTGPVVTMVNHAGGFEPWVAAIGRERLIPGFPNAGADFEDDTLHYTIVPGFAQATTLGELDGQRSQRVRRFAAAFRAAGFPSAISPRMDAWQRYHAAWIAPMLLAARAAGGDIERIATDRGLHRRMMLAVREAFRVLRAHGFPTTPGMLRVLDVTPIWLVSLLLRIAARNPSFERTMMQAGARLSGEGQVLTEQIAALARDRGVATPYFDALLSETG